MKESKSPVPVSMNSEQQDNHQIPSILFTRTSLLPMCLQKHPSLFETTTQMKTLKALNRGKGQQNRSETLFQSRTLKVQRAESEQIIESQPIATWTTRMLQDKIGLPVEVQTLSCLTTLLEIGRLKETFLK